MSDNITVAELDKELKELVKWERFGIHLTGITPTYIELIKKELVHSVSDQKYALFSKWLEQCVSPTWEKVVVALEIIDENFLACKLRKKHNLIISTDSYSKREGQASMAEAQQQEIFDKESVQQLITSLQNIFVDVSLDCKDELNSRIKSKQVTLSDVIEFTKSVASNVYDLKNLNDVQTVDSYFDVITPHYHFIDFYLLQKLAEQFLGHSEALNELNTYYIHLENLLKHVKFTDLYQSLKIHCLMKSPQQIPITLHIRKVWKKASIYSFKMFLQVLLDLDHNGIAQLFRIIPGSLIIIALLPENITSSLMKHAKHMIEFMRLTGIISLQVGDTYILQDEEEMADEKYSFEIGLIKSAQANNIEAVKFLLEYLETDINTQTNKPSSVDNYKKDTEQLANVTMPTTADNLKESAINNAPIEQQHSPETTIITAQHILQTNTLPSGITLKEDLQLKKKSTELHPADKIQSDSNKNVSFIHDDGTSALMIASYNNDIDLLELLLVKGADPNLSTSGAGWTALMYGVRIGSIRVVNMLLEYKANPNIKKLSNGATALIYACMVCDVRILSTLLKYSADPSIQMNDGVTPLYFASMNGQLDVVKELLRATVNSDSPNNCGATPLYVASQNGHLQVVEKLLQAHVNPDTPADFGVTPLYIASHNGHLEVVERLLQAYVNPDTPADFGITPLCTASQNGHLKVVERLLQAKANPHSPNRIGATPLYVACQNGHLEVVERLLQAYVNPNTRDDYGVTPLYIASHNGHLQVVERLLQTNVNTHITCNNGTTPLHIATKNCHLEVVERLLQAGDNSDITSNSGETPLFMASENGYLEIVKRLLKAKVNPDSPNNNGATPLYIASQNGHLAVVETLLQARVNPDSPNCNGVTPLYIASENGHLEIVERLLKAKVNPDSPNDDKATPLFAASENGHLEIVKRLLQEKTNPNIQNNDGATPLYIASQNGHSEVVESLLQANVNPDTPAYLGVSPLYIACQNGHFEVVEKLLQAKGNPDFPNNNRATPLYIASKNGHLKIVERLLQATVNPDSPNSNGATPLYVASKNGHLKVVERLLKANLNPDITINNGITALHIASQNGHLEVVEMLLQANVNPDSPNNNGATPLYIASQKGHLEIVGRLLQANANPDSSDKNGVTPLYIASENGYLEIVERLLLAKVNPETSNNNGVTPLYIARQNGHFEIVEKLLQASINPDTPIDTGFGEGIYQEKIRDPPTVSDEECIPKHLIVTEEAVYSEDLVENINVVFLTVNDDEYGAVVAKTEEMMNNKALIKVIKNEIIFLIGSFDHYKVAIMQTKSGQQEILMLLPKLLQLIKAKYIVSVGMCYKMNQHQRYKLGDVIVANRIMEFTHAHLGEDCEVEQHQIEGTVLAMFRNADGFVLKCLKDFVNVKFDPVVAQSTIITNEDHKKNIQRQSPYVLIGEMEGGAIVLATRHVNPRPEVIVIKGVADWEDGNMESSNKWQKFASHAAASFVHFCMTQNSKALKKEVAKIQENIANQGKIHIKNVKGMFIGPPGVGKTITMNRLIGKMRNIELDGGMASTGIERPVTIPIYHDIERNTIFICKQSWSVQSPGQQFSTFVHCMGTKDSAQHVSIDSICRIRTCSAQQVSNETIHRAKADPVQVSNSGMKNAEMKEATIPQPIEFEPSPKKQKEFVSSLTDYQSPPKSPSIGELLEGLVKQSNWNWAEAQQLLQDVKNTTLFHIIDTGGQPEFFDILPLLIHGPCFALIFINLIHPLTEPFSVTFRHKPDEQSMIKYESVYNQLQIIHMSLAAIDSLNSQPQKNSQATLDSLDCEERRNQISKRSAAFILATHLDKTSAKGVNLQEVKKQIDDSVNETSFYKNVLLKCLFPGSGEHQFLYALNNYSGDEKEINVLCQKLTYLIQNTFKEESLPTSWGLFYLLLRHKYEKRGQCTLEESEQVGLQCRIKDINEVKMSLLHFHNRFGTILYYEKVASLDSTVICDPNLVFKPITKLIAESYGVTELRNEEAISIRTTGEVRLGFLEEICSENMPLQHGLQHISIKAIVDLLKYHNIIAECVVDGEKKLFMSFLLKPCPQDKLPNVDISALNGDVQPLLFTFEPHNYQPIGLFHVLTARLLENDNFTLDQPRYKNKLSFRFTSSTIKVHIYSTLQILICEVHIKFNIK